MPEGSQYPLPTPVQLLRQVLIDRVGRRDDDFIWRERQSPFDLSSCDSLCILHTDSKLGDALVVSLLVEAIAYSSGTNVSVATTPSYVEYWRANKKVQDVIEVPEATPDGRFRNTKRARAAVRPYRSAFDVVVSFDSFATLSLFCMIDELNAKTVVGFNKDPYRIFDYSMHDVRFGTQKGHTTDRIRALMDLFQLDVEFEVLRPFSGYTRSEQVDAEEVLARGQGTGRKILLNTYAASPHRSFCPASIDHLIGVLDRQAPDATVFVSVPDRDTRVYMEAIFHPPKSIEIVYIPPFYRFGGLFAFVEQMDLVLTPDSGIAHVAAAKGKPLVCFYYDREYNPIVWKPVTTQYRAVMSRTGESVNDLDGSEEEAVRSILAELV